MLLAQTKLQIFDKRRNVSLLSKRTSTYRTTLISHALPCTRVITSRTTASVGNIQGHEQYTNTAYSQKFSVLSTTLCV